MSSIRQFLLHSFPEELLFFFPLLFSEPLYSVLCLSSQRTQCTFYASTTDRCNGGINPLVLINKVALHRAPLVLGWVTVCRQINPLSYPTNYLGQLSLLSLRVGKLNNGLSGWSSGGTLLAQRLSLRR